MTNVLQFRQRGRPISKQVFGYTIPDSKETSFVSSPPVYKYGSCPRCAGTLYRPPAVYYFHCMVCGWEQQCDSCLGNMTMWDREHKGCDGCRQRGIYLWLYRVNIQLTQ